MTSLQSFLIKPENRANIKKQLYFERFGIDNAFTLQSIDQKTYDHAIAYGTTYDKAHHPHFDQAKAELDVVLNGVCEPNFREQEWIDEANKSISEINAQMTEAVKKENERREKEKGDKLTKEETIKPKLINQVQTPYDLINYILRAGEIHIASEEIIRLSGFYTSMKEVEKEVKN